MTIHDADQDLARKLRVRIEIAWEFAHDAVKTARRVTGDARVMWISAAMEGRADAKRRRATLAQLKRAKTSRERSDQT